MIGFGRIISDGQLHALIADLIIMPNYKRKGIGTKILDGLVKKAEKEGVDQILLFCAENKKEFYLKNNFKTRSENAPGMEYDKA